MEGSHGKGGRLVWLLDLPVHLLLTVLAFFLSINLIIPFKQIYLRKDHEGDIFISPLK